MARYECSRSRGGELPEAPAPEEKSAIAGALLEPQAMDLLEHSGIPVPPYRFASEKTKVTAACEAVGYPVVMKVVSPQILHKSDVGGVILNVAGASAAEDAFDRLAEVARRKDFRGVVVYPMLRGGTEIILGMTRDPQFGPVVAFGLGGIYAEVLRDVVLRVAPVSRDGALEMISSIRSFGILKGARGQKPANLGALEEASCDSRGCRFSIPKSRKPILTPFSSGRKASSRRTHGFYPFK